MLELAAEEVDIDKVNSVQRNMDKTIAGDHFNDIIDKHDDEYLITLLQAASSKLISSFSGCTTDKALGKTIEKTTQKIKDEAHVFKSHKTHLSRSEDVMDTDIDNF